MFLSKRNGIYHLFYEDPTGKRRSCSTKSRTKPEAMKFLREFDVAWSEKAQKVTAISFESFAREYLAYSAGVHTKKTVDADRTALNEFGRVVGLDKAMDAVTLAEIERFLTVKTTEASAWTARKYYLALAASFERALSWGYIPVNL